MKKIDLFKVYMPPREVLMPKLEKVLYSGHVAEGEEVKKFEEDFGRYIHNPNVISLNSGTAALHTALILAGVKRGDEVISTPITAEPTNMAIMHSGATIVWADVDINNGNISPNSVRQKIAPKTKAIMAVDYSGIPVDLTQLTEISEEFNIPIIEDAAHALGAKYDGKMIGNHSDFVIFSFQAIKHLTTVDGGMLACKSKELCEKGRLVKWFGIDRTLPRTELDIELVGYKYHMNNVNAVIGQVQLNYISERIRRYIENGRYFDKELSDIPGLELLKFRKEAEPSYWLYTLNVERRDRFIRYLSENGIAAEIVHQRNDVNSVFSQFKTHLPGVDAFYEKMVHTPCGWWVTEEDREHIVETIRKGW